MAWSLLQRAHPAPIISKKTVARLALKLTAVMMQWSLLIPVSDQATVDALANNFLPGLYRNALEKGIADSVLGPARKMLKQNVIRLFPQLSRSLNQLEYG